MANAMYDKGREAFLGAVINASSDDIRAQLVDSSLYTPDMANHDNLDDIPSGARVGSAVALAGKSITNGILKASNTTIPSVTGASAEYVVLYKNTGTESTSRLICLIDTATGLPVTPNSGDITLQWDATNGIFKL